MFAGRSTDDEYLRRLKNVKFRVKKIISGLVAMTMMSGCFTMLVESSKSNTSYFATVPADIVTFPLQVGGLIVLWPWISDFSKIK